MISTEEVIFCFHVSQVKVEMRKILFRQDNRNAIPNTGEKAQSIILPEQSHFSVIANVFCILQWKYLLYI